MKAGDWIMFVLSLGATWGLVHLIDGPLNSRDVLLIAIMAAMATLMRAIREDRA